MSENKYPERAEDVLVTQKMLFGIRNELKSFTRSEVRKVSSKLISVESQHESLKSEIHRLGISIEEQNARNKVVLDGLSNLFYRQERLEKFLEEINHFIQGVKIHE